MKGLLGITAIAASLLVATPANAVVIGFDDLAAGTQVVPEYYHGLKWANANIINKNQYPSSGYSVGTVSGTYAAWGGTSSNNPTTISSEDDPFSFISGYFTAAWEEGVQLLIEGFSDDDNIADYTTTLTLSKSAPLFFEANWVDLRELRLTTTRSGGRHTFVIDDLSIGKAAPVEVPEPLSLALVGAGLIGVAAARRRKH